jgi:hypothetical protein
MVTLDGSNRLRFLRGSLGVSVLAEGILRTEERGQEALLRYQSRGYECGIRYWASAPAYARSEEYQGRFLSEDPTAEAGAFQAGKSAQRTADGAAEDLLRILQRTGPAGPPADT